MALFDRPRLPPWGWSHGAHVPPEELNELGHRGRRDAGAEPVLLVGDSQVETTRPFERMPERFLAEELGRSVLSVAAAGWGQDQQLLALRRALLRVRPKAVVLWFTPTNDLWNNLFPTSHLHPKPTFRWQAGRLEEPRWPKPWRWELLWLRAFGGSPFPRDGEWDLPPAYALGDEPAPELRMPPGEDFRTEKTHYHLYLSPPSPRMRQAMALTRALLEEIRRLVAPAPFLVVYRKRDRLWEPPQAPTAFRVPGGTVRLSRRAGREVVERTLAGFFRREVSLPPGLTLSATDPHLGDEGNRRMMAAVAEVLSPLFSRRESRYIDSHSFLTH